MYMYIFGEEVHWMTRSGGSKQIGSLGSGPRAQAWPWSPESRTRKRMPGTQGPGLGAQGPGPRNRGPGPVAWGPVSAVRKPGASAQGP